MNTLVARISLLDCKYQFCGLRGSNPLCSAYPSKNLLRLHQTAITIRKREKQVEGWEGERERERVIHWIVSLDFLRPIVG